MPYPNQPGHYGAQCEHPQTHCRSVLHAVDYGSRVFRSSRASVQFEHTIAILRFRLRSEFSSQLFHDKPGSFLLSGPVHLLEVFWVKDGDSGD